MKPRLYWALGLPWSAALRNHLAASAVSSGDALTLGIQHAEVVLRAGLTLVCRAAKPLRRFGIGLRQAAAVGVHHADAVLGVAVSRFRQRDEDLQGGRDSRRGYRRGTRLRRVPRTRTRRLGEAGEARGGDQHARHRHQVARRYWLLVGVIPQLCTDAGRPWSRAPAGGDATLAGQACIDSAPTVTAPTSGGHRPPAAEVTWRNQLFFRAIVVANA